MTNPTKSIVSVVIAFASAGFVSAVLEMPSFPKATIVGVVAATVMGLMLYALPSRPAT